MIIILFLSVLLLLVTAGILYLYKEEKQSSKLKTFLLLFALIPFGFSVFFPVGAYRNLSPPTVIETVVFICNLILILGFVRWCYKNKKDKTVKNTAANKDNVKGGKGVVKLNFKNLRY